MNKSMIIIYPGSYDNTDAYESVLTYVSKKDYVFGYAIPQPLSRDSLIVSYRLAEEKSNYVGSRYIYHFTISIPSKNHLKHLLELADNIAITFGHHYQVTYSLDLETDHPHVHFAVNAYSYQPTYPYLTEGVFDIYIQDSCRLLQSYFPQYNAIVKYKEDTNV